jgi:hypothetical protein
MLLCSSALPMQTFRRSVFVIAAMLSQSQCATGQMSHGGIRLPPNVSKILFHWGLERALREVSITSTAVEIAICSYKSPPIQSPSTNYLSRRYRRVCWHPPVGRRGSARDQRRIPLSTCTYDLFHSPRSDSIYSYSMSVSDVFCMKLLSQRALKYGQASMSSL